MTVQFTRSIMATLTKHKFIKPLLPWIATDPLAAVLYADQTRLPFPEGEAAIAKSSQYSLFYAVNILKGRFPAGEARIAQHHNNREVYETFVLMRLCGMSRLEAHRVMYEAFQPQNP